MIEILKALLVRFAVKGAVIKAVQYEGDRLRDEIKAQVAAKGPGAVDAALDAITKRLVVGIEARSPKWAWLQPYKAKLEAEVATYESEIKAELDAEVLKEGPAAIDAVFAQAEAGLAARINAIPI